MLYHLPDNEELITETNGYDRDALFLAQDRTGTEKEAYEEPLDS